MTPLFEKTLAIIQSNLISRTPEIEAIIKARGLTVLQKKRFLLRKDQAVRFFSQGQRRALQKANFRDDDVERDLKAFIDSMTSGPIDVLIIAGFDAVSRWLELIGQTDPFGEQTNCISVLFGGGTYGSPDVLAASREIRFFYPETIFEADFGLGTAREYLSDTVNPLLLKGLIMLSKEKPQIPVLWLAQWLLDNRPHEH
ncbi:nucleoside diphosphate kinase homolog 5-like [Stegodyphus dumicola]|uniref:nucleoside diphosphate kinase homolog 5-like n=1 Tax=Stegodyphus dumicola TaxID=202533 RepID=UPI0015B0E8BA|nr:nucleoside diphosphate kinase homolog 5-like [Stegodyphus dumicola]XP_035213897.1 nucleoside diphosphate kinase homolog 5-like [Stegodyphus dumicola]